MVVGVLAAGLALVTALPVLVLGLTPLAIVAFVPGALIGAAFARSTAPSVRPGRPPSYWWSFAGVLVMACVGACSGFVFGLAVREPGDPFGAFGTVAGSSIVCGALATGTAVVMISLWGSQVDAE